MKKSFKNLLSLVLCLVFSFALAVPAFAGSTGYMDTTDAYTELNNFRASGDAWYWNSDNKAKTSVVGKLKPLKRDPQLEQTAKTRAKEIAQSFSHTRPNGTSCFSAYPSSLMARGENIAEGQSSAKEVTEDWMEKNDPYSGQGHRRNMLDSKFNAVGIACYAQNGTYYWVQSFGRD